MLIVAGLSLKNLHPRVWDSTSPYYLPALQAVMISYADFHQRPAARKAAMERGLHDYLGVPRTLAIYLDNGAFYFLKRAGSRPTKEYEAFVAAAQPDWYPIPSDFIPTPVMSPSEQHACFTETMTANRTYEYDGFVPIMHIGTQLDAYVTAIKADSRLAAKPSIALGGIVPNLLRAPKARPYSELLDALRRVRQSFADKCLHVFGMGGTATVHLAMLLGMDSVDSSGWRNRAARGIVQLPGSGDRSLLNLGAWRGRAPSDDELAVLEACPCPACSDHRLEGLRAGALGGFSNRATHNLWVLLNEVVQINEHIASHSYADWHAHHLNNSVYLPLIKQLLPQREKR